MHPKVATPDPISFANLDAARQTFIGTIRLFPVLCASNHRDLLRGVQLPPKLGWQSAVART